MIFTKTDGCGAGVETDWTEEQAAAEVPESEADAGAAAPWAAGWTSWTGCPAWSLCSLSAAMDSLTSFSCSTDADLGNTKWVSA